MAVPDYYAVLELEPNCDSADVKAAYRALARKWHPDANLDNLIEAESRFKEFAEAYEILGDREKRAKYNIIRPRVRRATPAPAPSAKKETEQPSRSAPQPAPRAQKTVIAGQLPGSTQENLNRRKADPDLERAYSTFDAAFDRNDEKSATFSGFFNTFMNVKRH